MVQDPQCGLYITKKEAYADKIGTKLVYFCSKECYQKYLQDNQNKGVKK
jgi:YHS domain-containing protein